MSSLSRENNVEGKFVLIKEGSGQIYGAVRNSIEKLLKPSLIPISLKIGIDFHPYLFSLKICKDQMAVRQLHPTAVIFNFTKCIMGHSYSAAKKILGGHGVGNCSKTFCSWLIGSAQNLL